VPPEKINFNAQEYAKKFKKIKSRFPFHEVFGFDREIHLVHTLVEIIDFIATSIEKNNIENIESMMIIEKDKPLENFSCKINNIIYFLFNFKNISDYFLLLLIKKFNNLSLFSSKQ